MSEPAKPVPPDDPRVRLAEDRTVLAAERTFVAWLRTGLAFLGVGLAAQRFLREVLAVWPLKVLSLTLSPVRSPRSPVPCGGTGRSGRDSPMPRSR